MQERVSTGQGMSARGVSMLSAMLTRSPCQYGLLGHVSTAERLNTPSAVVAWGHVSMGVTMLTRHPCSTTAEVTPPRLAYQHAERVSTPNQHGKACQHGYIHVNTLHGSGSSCKSF